MYAKRPVKLPAFERLVRAHIHRGVPDEWKSVQDYTLPDLKVKDAVKQAAEDDNAPGSNRVTAAFIAELPEPVQGLWCMPTKPSSVAKKSGNRGMRPSSS